MAQASRAPSVPPMARLFSSMLVRSPFVVVAIGCGSPTHPAPNADLGTVLPGGVTGATGKGGAAGAGGRAGAAGFSAGAGGGGGAVVDGGAPWATSSCGSCLEAQCATETSACMIDASCSSYFFSCYAGCPIGGSGQPDPLCLSACSAKSPSTVAWTQLQACLGAMRQATGACTVQCSQ